MENFTISKKSSKTFYRTLDLNKSFFIKLTFLLICLVSPWHIGLGQSVSTTYTNNNGSSCAVFTFYNGNAYPIVINSIGTYAGSTGTQTAQFWTKPATGYNQGSAAAVSVANGWTMQASQSVATTANTTATTGSTAPLVLSGMNVNIPANSYWRFAVSLSTSLRYSTLGTQTGAFTANGCTIDCSASDGYGGTLASPSNTPRAFIGRINFTVAAACSGAPSAGIASISQASGCSGTTVTLSGSGQSAGTGISYQWQSAPSATGPWTNITGATSVSYNTNPTATTFYRLNTTCSNSALTSSTAAISYTVNLAGACQCGAYPAVYASSNLDEEISNVTVGSMTNASSCATIAGGAGSIQNRYSNYAGVVTGPSEMQGSSVNFSLTQTSCGGAYGNFFQIYVDWNQNGSFLDAGDQVYSQTTGVTGNHTVTGSFSVPPTATLGTTRMRIVNIEAGASTTNYAHTGYTWGETEDYCFTVTALTGCAGTPTGGTSSASTASACSGVNFTISNAGQSAGTGITYQWQSSTNNTTWTNVGASSSTYAALTTSQTTATYYRLLTTCTNSGISTGSSSILVNMGGACACASYCTPTYTSACSSADFINLVSTTGGSTNISNTNSGCSGAANNYSHHLSTSLTVQQGNSFTLNLQSGASWGQGFGVWIDYNQNLTFETSEFVYSTASSTALNSGVITIPASATVGTTRMRVRCLYAGTPLNTDACTSLTYGETEDYCVTITAAPACAGTPNPGATTASPSQVFAGGSTTLGITTAQNGTGISYQWQSGPSATGPWTSIGGATGATYVATPTTATYYQCVVTCSSSGASAVSTPILITTNAYCNPDYTGYAATPQNGNEGTVDGDMITNVTITGTSLNNTSTSVYPSAQYTFYSSLPAINLYPSNSYNVNVTAGNFTAQNFAVWIDYNDDNDFYDAGELIGYSAAATTVAYQTVSFTINLACTPPFGTHRMRVRDAYATPGSTMDPCATYGWGETEDYLITIVPGTPFTPTFTATPATPNCVGTQVTYTATAGQTNYAWTFPGTATLVSGGTSTSNTATVVYNSSGNQTITMNYSSPLGCASSGAVNNTISVGAGTFSTSAVNGDVVWRGASSVDWATPSNWYYYNGTTYTVAGVAPNNTTRTIIPANACVTQQPTVAAGTTVNAKDVVIETGATLTMTTGTLNVNGNFTNNGTFVAGTGTVAFNTAGTVSGNATTFFNVDVNNGVNFGNTLSTVNGTMTINNGGWVNTNPPTYGTSSLLKYNTGATYGRGFEWSTTSGPGYPNDVQISNATTINYPNVGGGAFSTNLGIRRNLTIDAGSNLYMDYNSWSASGSLTVGGNVTSAGDLSLGNQVGGDIYVGGNWVRTSGNFYPNNRAVFFNGASGNQTITKAGGESFPYMIVNKAAGNVVLANNVTVSGGLTLTNGLVEVGTNNMILGGATVTGGSSASYVKTASTGVLSRNVTGTAALFPVGNTSYNPAQLTNTGSADVFTMRVIDNVTADGTGVGATTSDAVVNRTWMIDEATAGGTVGTLRLYWNGAGEEINGFNSSSPFIAHYLASASMWDNAGGTLGAGYVETSGINSFSPFTISSSATFAPLPVELVSFQANCAGDNAVMVSWTTASEHNASHYIVEKSRNGNDWEVLGLVAAAGNSTDLLNYELIDQNANPGINYYRLAQYDIDGEMEMFDPVSANCEEVSQTTTVSTYPNPSNNSFYISLFTEEMEGEGVITLTDSKGTIVYSQVVSIQNGNSIFHVNDLNVAPGMYYIQVTNGNNSTDIVKHSLR